MGKRVVVAGREADPFEPMHVLVEIAPDQWGDVRGVHGPEMLESMHRRVPRFVPAVARIVEPEELGAILDACPHGWLREDPLLAGPFVEPVMTEWGIELDGPAVEAGEGLSL
jgi:hypothetical protein